MDYTDFNFKSQVQLLGFLALGEAETGAAPAAPLTWRDA